MASRSRRLFVCGVGSAAVLPWGAVVRAAPVVATTGSITGRITNGRRKCRSARGRAPCPYDRVIVYLEGVEEPPPNAAGVEWEIQQKGRQFRPSLSAVVLGTTLSFPNDDAVYHNVYSESEPLQFNVNTYRGESKSRVANKLGVIEILCDRHEEMRAHVLVLETRFFVRPEGDGTYVLNGVPPGTYVIHVWQPYGKQYKRNIEVTAGQATTFDQQVSPGRAPRHRRRDGTMYDPY